MTMTIDHQHRFGPLNLDHMSSYPASTASPQFSNPWASSTSTAPSHPTHGLYVPAPGLSATSSLDRTAAAAAAARTSSGSTASSMGSYGQIPVSTTSADLMSLNRMQTSAPGYADTTYTSTASPVHATYAPAAAPYESLGYAPAPVRSTFALAPESEHSRRFSHSGGLQDDRRSFADALDASHGMLAMSQETPRNIYGTRSERGSGDSYGFPSTHSTSSSISSAGNFSNYYAADSVSDYSTAGSDIESVTSRTLPRPTSLMTNQVPPAPQSMMGQFSSKVSSSTQKKHKCKVCDKRFTRPSSLQTHMYSHTGEKPFACEVEGCGRHFSVVSNLRRHRKVHKGETPSEAGSEDHHSD